jgi:hypothetical protein
LQKTNLVFILATNPILMKKLLSVFCSVLCIHCVMQTPVEAGSNSAKSSGEKGLMRALAVIVNPEANKKAPAKTVTITSTESL